MIRGAGLQTRWAEAAWAHQPRINLADVTEVRIDLADPCPLCGFGGAGSEHLCIWCPAVAEAWFILVGPDGRTFLQAVREPDRDAGLVGAVLHQTSFLHGALCRNGQAT